MSSAERREQTANNWWHQAIQFPAKTMIQTVGKMSITIEHTYIDDCKLFSRQLFDALIIEWLDAKLLNGRPFSNSMAWFDMHELNLQWAIKTNENDTRILWNNKKKTTTNLIACRWNMRTLNVVPADIILRRQGKNTPGEKANSPQPLVIHLHRQESNNPKTLSRIRWRRIRTTFDMHKQTNKANCHTITTTHSVVCPLAAEDGRNIFDDL